MCGRGGAVSGAWCVGGEGQAVRSCAVSETMMRNIKHRAVSSGQWAVSRVGGSRVESVQQGNTRQGLARLGEARQGLARRGEARRGKARRGEARHGEARHGAAWQRMARQQGNIWRLAGSGWLVLVWSGAMTSQILTTHSLLTPHTCYSLTPHSSLLATTCDLVDAWRT